MVCKKRPYGLNTRKISKSPFRGNMNRVRNTLRAYKARKQIGFTAISSLKSMGLLPRSSGCFILGNKYR